MDVFWRNGYEATSCEELLAAMGINSGSMYAAFGDKQALYDKALSHYCDKMLAEGMRMLNGPGTPLEQVRAVVKFWADFMTQPDCKGCFVDSVLIEFGKEKRGAAVIARQLTGRITQAFESKLTEARKSGELSNPTEPAELALFLLNMKQGLSVMSRAGAGESSIRSVVKTALAMLR